MTGIPGAAMLALGVIGFIAAILAAMIELDRQRVERLAERWRQSAADANRTAKANARERDREQERALRAEANLRRLLDAKTVEVQVYLQPATAEVRHNVMLMTREVRVMTNVGIAAVPMERYGAGFAIPDMDLLDVAHGEGERLLRERLRQIGGDLMESAMARATVV